MRIVLKSLVVWLLLLAIPVQGFASATMLLCAPMSSAPTPMPHDHQLMLDASAGAHHHLAPGSHVNATPAHDGERSGAHHAGGKCQACETCCFGAVMAPANAVRVPVETQHFAPNFFNVGHIGSVDLALPERPPQTWLT